MNLTSQIEAALFIASRAMEIDELAKILNRKREEIIRAINTLNEEYIRRKSAFRLLTLSDDRVMLTLEKDLFAKFLRIAPKSYLSLSELKTLILIALSQPISQRKIAKIRGDHSYRDMKRLEKFGFIIREKSNGKVIVRTTKYFADYFGLHRNVNIMKKELMELIKRKSYLPTCKK